MNTYTFIKKNGSWQLLHHKAGTHRKEPLPLDDGSNSLLNLLADGNDKVKLRLTTEPFKDAQELELLQSCQPFLEGGYYRMRQDNKGTENSCQLWVSDVTKYVFGAVPDRIYVRTVK